MFIIQTNKEYFIKNIKVLNAKWGIKMTEKTQKNTEKPDLEPVEYCKIPERSVSHFCSAKDPGIVVDVEIQAGDPVDSQFMRDFMSEFKAFYSKKSA